MSIFLLERLRQHSTYRNRKVAPGISRIVHLLMYSTVSSESMSTQEQSNSYFDTAIHTVQHRGTLISPTTCMPDRSNSMILINRSSSAPILSPQTTLASADSAFPSRSQLHSPEYTLILAQHYYNPRSAALQGSCTSGATSTPSPIFLDQQWTLPPLFPYHPPSCLAPISSALAASVTLPPYLSPPCSFPPSFEPDNTPSSPIDTEVCLTYGF